MDLNAYERRCTAFKGGKQIAAGPLEQVVGKLKSMVVEGHVHGVLVFDDMTAEQIDLDFRDRANFPPVQEGKQAGGDLVVSVCNSQSDPQLQGQATGAIQGRPGRPKLGVVAKEVTLLPRHWQWLSSQPGGASVALRKLVEDARKGSADRDAIRQSQEAAYKFMSATAGNYQGFEEAARALFARDKQHFDDSTSSWPPDICKYVKRLAASCLLQVAQSTDM